MLVQFIKICLLVSIYLCDSKFQRYHYSLKINKLSEKTENQLKKKPRVAL